MSGRDIIIVFGLITFALVTVFLLAMCAKKSRLIESHSRFGMSLKISMYELINSAPAVSVKGDDVLCRFDDNMGQGAKKRHMHPRHMLLAKPIANAPGIKIPREAR
jgi:hypothetical protein